MTEQLIPGREILSFLLRMLRQLHELPEEKARKKMERIINCLQDDE